MNSVNDPPCRVSQFDDRGRIVACYDLLESALASTPQSELVQAKK